MIINLTPHPIKLYKALKDQRPTAGNSFRLDQVEPQPYRILKSKGAARIEREWDKGMELYGVPIDVEAGAFVKGLPAQKPGVFYIVSRAIFDRIRRDDLLCPGLVVTNEQGKAVGVVTLDKQSKEPITL